MSLLPPSAIYSGTTTTCSPDVPLAEDLDADEEALTEIALAFAASSASSAGYKEPTTLCEVLDSPDAKQWKQAIKKEVQALQDMGTFTVIDDLRKEEKPLAPSSSSRLSKMLMAPLNASRPIWLHAVILKY